MLPRLADSVSLLVHALGGHSVDIQVDVLFAEFDIDSSGTVCFDEVKLLSRQMGKDWEGWPAEHGIRKRRRCQFDSRFKTSHTCSRTS